VIVGAGGSLANAGSLAGGAGGLTTGVSGGPGGAGVVDAAAGPFVNGGSLQGGVGGVSDGGSGTGGVGGAGLSVTAGGSVANNGSIAGGAGGQGFIGASGGAGGTGVSVAAGGSLTNAGSITAGAGGTSPGFGGGASGSSGTGVVFSGGAGTLVNQLGGNISNGVVMGNYANAVTLQIGSTITGGLNIGNSSSATLTLTDNGTGGTQNYSSAVAGATTFAGQLVKAGGGTWALNQSMTYAGGTTVTAGTLRANAASATGTGPVEVAAGATLGGNGSVGAVTVDGTITAGPNAATVGTLTTGQQAWEGGGTFLAKFAADDSANDRLVMTGLTVSATPGAPFTVDVAGAAIGDVAGQYVLAVDTGATYATTPDPFTLASLVLQVNGSAAPAGDYLAEASDTMGGVDLLLITAPEPTSLLLLATAAGPLALGRRRRGLRPRRA
jgi:hypothetical protein